MKSIAAISMEVGGQLIIDEIEIPNPSPDQVIVKLFSSGVCHSQLHQMHQPELPRPLMLGHEGTGVITHVGTNVNNLKEGDHAIVTWVPKTPSSTRLKPSPSGVTYRETLVNGNVYTWGNDVLVHQDFVVPISKQYPTDLSCIVGCAILTGAGAVMNTAKVRPGNSVAVYGVGGVGLSAIKMASILEAFPIIAVDLDENKLSFAKKFGATHFVNASETDPIETILQITNGGVDFAFDAIGVKKTNEQILPSVRGGGSGADNHGGMAVLIGIPNQMITIDPALFVRGQRTYRGSLGATYPEKDFNMFLKWHEEGKFPLDQLITKRYKLEEINTACEDLQSGTILGRAIIEF
ncbi:MAG TPA: alcohol dehydrogenase [Dehalococcoidia bacterium]|jgi:Zn-dependent alcohol dehydrogenase|nr:alcohol dehydrogenase [Dehalococcoidia bacterium]|tara:strand:- start:677 stop:1726 length:1050 start_codon:yes stop_codon:yes gene_type:complete